MQGIATLLFLPYLMDSEYQTKVYQCQQSTKGEVRETYILSIVLVYLYHRNDIGLTFLIYIAYHKNSLLLSTYSKQQAKRLVSI